MCKTRWKVSTSDTTSPLTLTIIKINAILEVIWNSSSEYWSKACIQFGYMNFVIYLNSRNLDQHVREVSRILWQYLPLIPLRSLWIYCPLSLHIEYIALFSWCCQEIAPLKLTIKFSILDGRGSGESQEWAIRRKIVVTFSSL